MSTASNSKDPVASIQNNSYDVIIVGAGFAGMYLLHRLRKLGMSVKVFEKADDVGGTWYWNRYPGARCDVEVMEYSYSFSAELQQDWVWTTRYACQPEILRYANYVADRFDLRKDIQFNTVLTAAHYDESARRWNIETADGEHASAQFCVMATGCLSASKEPEIDGLDRYEGEWYHTAHWPKEGVDFVGKKVGIIGTGATGIQVIPVVAKQAEHLTVFQRTPNYVLEAHNRPLTPEDQAEWKGDYPRRRAQARHTPLGCLVEPNTQSALEVSAAERERTYQYHWDKGNLIGLLSSYADLVTNEEANNTVSEFMRRIVRETVKDPVTAEKLMPKDYPYGTKRPPMGTDYYATFNRDNVSLVDLRDEAIVEFTPKGIRTVDKEYEFEVLILASGFNAMTGALTAIDIRGKDNTAFSDAWADGPDTYLGVSISGFPNLFHITGPGSPSVLTNMLVSTEQHVDWITDCIAYLRDHDIASIEATPEAQRDWVAHVQEVANTTLYPRANSWYMGANVPGKARVFMPYVGGLGAYGERIDEVASKGYEGFELTPKAAQPA